MRYEQFKVIQSYCFSSADCLNFKEFPSFCFILCVILKGAVALNGTSTPNAAAIDPIFFDNVQCVGTEAMLVDCLANALGDNDCTHTEDAGVACQEREYEYKVGHI